MFDRVTKIFFLIDRMNKYKCMKLKSALVLPFIFTWFNALCQQQRSAEALPNVVFILADDLGYGDLGCYGQSKFQTPNIDKLANEGMRFTQHYAGAPVCAPSRCALLTAKHTGHATIRGNKKVSKEGDYPLSDSDFILHQLYKSQGYVTGVFGKWGLGYPGSSGDVMKNGVDVFFGYYGHLAAHNYYPEYLWNNNQRVLIGENVHFSNKVYAPSMIQDSVLAFIESNKNHPFFLYLSTIIPHAELAAPASYVSVFTGKFEKETPYKGIKTIKVATRFGAYDAQKTPKAAYAAMITLLDDHVGEIVKKLKDAGVYENTIIVFTSDNGPHKEGGANPDYFNSSGGLRGYKRDLYEGGIRVPLIINWPGKIKPGNTDIISGNWDLMPTLAEILHTAPPEKIDGISLYSTIFGQPESQKKHPYLYWEFHEQGGKQAIRMGKWKAIKLNVKHPSKAYVELYDMEKDVSEGTDVSAQYPEVLKELKELMNKEHTPNAAFRF